MTGSKPVALPLGDGPINSVSASSLKEDYSGCPALTPATAPALLYHLHLCRRLRGQ